MDPLIREPVAWALRSETNRILPLAGRVGWRARGPMPSSDFSRSALEPWSIAALRDSLTRVNAVEDPVDVALRERGGAMGRASCCLRLHPLKTDGKRDRPGTIPTLDVSLHDRATRDSVAAKAPRDGVVCRGDEHAGRCPRSASDAVLFGRTDVSGVDARHPVLKRNGRYLHVGAPGLRIRQLRGAPYVEVQILGSPSIR